MLALKVPPVTVTVDPEAAETVPYVELTPSKLPLPVIVGTIDPVAFSWMLSIRLLPLPSVAPVTVKRK